MRGNLERSGILLSLAIGAFSQNVGAQGISENPAIINSDTNFSVALEGGRTEGFEFQIDRSNFLVNIGPASYTDKIQNTNVKYNQETQGLALSYVFNDNIKLIGGIFGGVQDQGGFNSDSLSGYKMALKLNPSDQGPLKVGLIIGVDRTVSEYSGQYAPPLTTYSDGVNQYQIRSSVDGTESLTITNYQAVIGASYLMEHISPYLNVIASKVDGNYSFRANGSATVDSWPVGGGLVTSSTNNVSYNYKSGISSKNMIGSAVGVSITPNNNIIFNLELVTLLENSFKFSLNYMF